MTTSILHVCILLVVLCVSDGQSTTSEDSRCSYTFNVPAGDCGQRSAEDDFLKSSVMSLQAQFKLLAGKQNEDIVNLRQESTRQKEDIVKLTDENIKLRQEISTIKEGAVGGSNRSAVNLKQCSKRGMNEQKEYGLVFLCQFVKKRDDTVLRVVWNGDLRLIHSGDKYGSCRRWFFTINGLECREPRTIDTQLHAHAKGTNMHRPAYVEGYCRGIPAGDADVAWNVGDCSNVGRYKQESANIGDSYTGWVATVRIIVEEVDVEDAGNVIV